ncbi:MAG: hypothetical protein IKW63_04680 [Elusimicrobiaceae bacterium]|nr:hypothetical protein [Elusimicrobiaceae bacterium]
MFCVRRVLAVFALLCFARMACAFTCIYGDYLEVKDVENKKGVLIMPTTNGQYKNIKVLSKEVYRFLQSCESDCRYAVADVVFESVNYRKAFTRSNLLIADIDLNKELALTFLVFKNEDGFFVKAPQEVVFKDKKLQKQIESYLIKLAEKTL